MGSSYSIRYNDHPQDGEERKAFVFNAGYNEDGLKFAGIAMGTAGIATGLISVEAGAVFGAAGISIQVLQHGLQEKDYKRTLERQLRQKCTKELNLGGTYNSGKKTLSWSEDVRVVVMTRKPDGKAEFDVYHKLCWTGKGANDNKSYDVLKDFDRK